MLEHRFYELRESDLDSRIISGVAVSYSDTAKVKHFEERFLPGAFAGRSDDVTLTYMHDRSRPLCRTGSGLTLTDSPEEMRFEAVLPNTQDADDALEMVKSKIFRGASVSFHALDDQWNGKRREIRQAHLAKIGLVDTPAYPKSTVEARYQDDQLNDLEIQEEEQRLLGVVASLVGRNALKKIGQKVIAPRLLSLAAKNPSTALLAKTLDDSGALNALGIKKPGPGWKRSLINTLDEEVELLPGFSLSKGKIVGYVAGTRIGSAIAGDYESETYRPLQSFAQPRKRFIL